MNLSLRKRLTLALGRPLWFKHERYFKRFSGDIRLFWIGKPVFIQEDSKDRGNDGRDKGKTKRAELSKIGEIAEGYGNLVLGQNETLYAKREGIRQKQRRNYDKCLIQKI